MFTVNKYESGFVPFGSKTQARETSKTNFTKNWAGLRYHVGGNGRDTYIFNDNGGNSIMNKPRYQEKSTGFLPNVNRSPVAAKKFTTADSMAKSIRYKTDGSGRDSYCTANDGGFTNPSKKVAIDPRIAFKNSLRGYE